MSFQLTHEALKQRGLTPSEMLTLVYLTDATFADTGKCEISLRHLEEIMPISHEPLMRALRGLKEKGVITSRLVPHCNGKKIASYTFNLSSSSPSCKPPSNRLESNLQKQMAPGWNPTQGRLESNPVGRLESNPITKDIITRDIQETVPPPKPSSCGGGTHSKHTSQDHETPGTSATAKPNRKSNPQPAKRNGFDFKIIDAADPSGYPVTPMEVEKYLQSIDSPGLDWPDLVALFNRVSKNGWRDSRGLKIRDWRAFFATAAEKRTTALFSAIG